MITIKLFGNIKELALGYGIDRINKETEFKFFVDNKSLCTFVKNGLLYEFRWDLKELVDWLEVNLDVILNEESFPLAIDGNTGVELYNNSGDFNTEDDIVFDSWYTKRQEWYFRHSWYSSRAGGYLADIFFRKVEGKLGRVL